MKKPGIAVVGTGYIGALHIETIAAPPEARLHAICSTPRSEERARQLKESYGAERITADFDDVVADRDVDVVDGARSVAVCCAISASVATGGPLGVELDF